MSNSFLNPLERLKISRKVGDSIDYFKIVPFLNKIAITSLHIIYSRIDPCEIHIICCKAYNFLTRELYLETSGCSLIILSTMGILWNLCFWLKSDLKDIPLLREFISDLSICWQSSCSGEGGKFLFHPFWIGHIIIFQPYRKGWLYSDIFRHAW